MRKTVTMKDFTNLLADNPKVIDVRETYEYQAGHIEGSVNLPLSQITSQVKTLDPNERYLLVCASGARSGNACDYLSSLGYNVSNVEGGLMAWRGELV